MAICRCLEVHACPPSPKGGPPYIFYVKPLGYPLTDVYCGLCTNPAVVWLKEWEVMLYKMGQRSFSIGGRQVKVVVEDSGVYEYKDSD